MKKIILFLSALVVFQTTIAYSQCEPDAQYTDLDAGIYPIDSADTSTSSLPTGQENQAYETVLTAVLPDMVMLELNPGEFFPANLDSITISDITGLPPGMNYECSPSDCLFLDQSMGCILLSGTPTEAGTYFLTIHSRLYAFPISPEITFPGELVSGEYKIIIDEDVAIDEPIKDVIGLGQNVPNPFYDMTEITVDTKQSGEFDFKVYNILGKLLHDEQVVFSTGKNVVQFDGKQLQSGMYFYSIGQGNEVVTRRMVVHRP